MSSLTTAERDEWAWEKGRGLTGKDEMSRAAWGSIMRSIPDRGCPERKCVRVKDHDGKHWPAEVE